MNISISFKSASVYDWRPILESYNIDNYSPAMYNLSKVNVLYTHVCYQAISEATSIFSDKQKCWTAGTNKKHLINFENDIS